MKSQMLYARAVCFISLLIGCVLASVAVYDVLEMAVPDVLYPSIERNRVEHAQRVRQLQRDLDAGRYLGGQAENIRHQIRTPFYADEHVTAQAFRSLVAMLIGLTFCVLVFLLHWRMTSSEKL